MMKSRRRKDSNKRMKKMKYILSIQIFICSYIVPRVQPRKKIREVYTLVDINVDR